jgi:hypothetical protein
LRAADRAACVLAAAIVAAGPAVSAHRLDEYLQAARIAIEPDRAEIEIDLTPGRAVADGVIAEIDGDSDGVLSPGERRAYVSRVLANVAVAIDRQPLRAEAMAASFPDLGAMRRGEGTIRLRLRAALPALSGGPHQLFFHNTYDPRVSVYLANALVPQSDRIGVRGQRRDAAQRELTIDFVARPASTGSLQLLPASLLALVAFAGFVTRWRRRPFPMMPLYRPHGRFPLG